VYSTVVSTGGTACPTEPWVAHEVPPVPPVTLGPQKGESSFPRGHRSSHRSSHHHYCSHRLPPFPPSAVATAPAHDPRSSKTAVVPALSPFRPSSPPWMILCNRRCGSQKSAGISQLSTLNSQLSTQLNCDITIFTDSYSHRLFVFSSHLFSIPPSTNSPLIHPASSASPACLPPSHSWRLPPSSHHDHHITRLRHSSDSPPSLLLDSPSACSVLSTRG
jgi:hypothetical protein